MSLIDAAEAEERDRIAAHGADGDGALTSAALGELAGRVLVRWEHPTSGGSAAEAPLRDVAAKLITMGADLNQV